MIPAEFFDSGVSWLLIVVVILLFIIHCVLIPWAVIKNNRWSIMGESYRVPEPPGRKESAE